MTILLRMRRTLSRGILVLLVAGCHSKAKPAVASAGAPPGPAYPAPPGVEPIRPTWWTPWTPPLPGTNAAPHLSPYEAEVLLLVNAARARGATCGGVPHPPQGPLAVMPQLTAAARGHSWDMALRDYMDHRAPGGSTPAMRTRAAGYRGPIVAENIARGYATPQEVMRGWMDSTGHCSNIMSPRYRYIGVGYAFTATNEMKHHWTTNFGG